MKKYGNTISNTVCVTDVLPEDQIPNNTLFLRTIDKEGRLDTDDDATYILKPETLVPSHVT
jgi:hypothetical protein